VGEVELFQREVVDEVVVQRSESTDRREGDSGDGDRADDRGSVCTPVIPHTQTHPSV
jgi:hypothetical protein